MDRTGPAGLALLLLAGCYESHLSAPPRSGAPRDGGAVLESSTFLLSMVSIPAPLDGVAPGADLDRADTTAAEHAWVADCEARQDFVGLDGATGVDDAFGTVVPSIDEALAPGSLDRTMAEAIATRQVLIGIELVSSGAVRVHALAPVAALQLDGRRRPLPDQRFVVGEELGIGTLRTAERRAQAALAALELPLPVPVATVAPFTSLADVQMRFDVGPSGLTDGELGARTTIEDALAVVRRIAPALEHRTRASLLRAADLDRDPTDSARCRSISIGLRFEAVPARFMVR